MAVKRTGSTSPARDSLQSVPDESTAPHFALLEYGRERFALLEKKHQITLLQLARETLQQYLTTGTVPRFDQLAPLLHRPQGAFVTLKKRRRLRGCTGVLMSDRPLWEVIEAMAIQAAINDTRFQPLVPGELETITIEISLLTPFRRVDKFEEITPGRDGVVLKKEGRQAVFLPQVATDMGWDRRQLLENLSRKAKLPPGSWQKNARLYIFEAQVFTEPDCLP